MLDILRFVHLLSVAVWVGMLVFFTFFATPAIFKSFPRETAGDIVGVLFPRYWLLGYVSAAVSVVSLIALSAAEKGFPAARLTLLAAMAAVTFYSGLSVGQRARAVKAELRSAEAGQKDALRAEFRRIHALSAGLNIAVIAAGTVVIYLTARSMKP